MSKIMIKYSGLVRVNPPNHQYFMETSFCTNVFSTPGEEYLEHQKK